MLKKAQREKFVQPDAQITMKFGPKELQFQALKYIQNFAIPNFFFHQMTAYSILRKEGVKVGKLDYLGAKDLQNA